VSDTGSAVKQVFDEMPARLNADVAAGMDAVFQYNLTGDGAGHYYTHVRNSGIEVTEGVHPAPAVTVTMSAADFVELSHGRLDGIMAFMTGKLKATGDLGLASKLQKLFRRGA
jgi:putative sterol carrier protein